MKRSGLLFFVYRGSPHARRMAPTSRPGVTRPARHMLFLFNFVKIYIKLYLNVNFMCG